VLVVTGNGTYGSYLLEIMRGEGLNLFTAGDTSDLTPSALPSYTTVVLGETTLTSGQVEALTDWVAAGGNLVAMRPDAQLAGLLGLSAAVGTVGEGYLKVDTSTAPGKGIYGETMQFHGVADRYNVVAGTQVVATLYSDATTRTSYPAVTLRSVGSAGGSAAAFTYDLAGSVVLTRQGNPDWADQNRDGEEGPNRSDDLFFGASEPDYVDLSKVDVPQADEQQRLLANVITEISVDALPLPRFWYLPRGEKAVIVMTSDNHDPQWNSGGSVWSRFDNELGASTSGCSVEDWKCIRSTAYLYPGNTTLTNQEAATYQSEGFELALHLTTDCATPTRGEYADMLAEQRSALADAYPDLDPSVTNRNHCIAWVGYTDVPEEEANAGIHLDTNYYYWPPDWVNDEPGVFTGSGFPQRFSTVDGHLIDAYQATTQMTDESGQSYPSTVDALLGAALGSKGFYGAFVANIHSDGGTEGVHADIIESAQDHGVPVISAQQLLTWTDGRNASSFSGLSVAGGAVTFHVTAASGANGLQAMVPVQGATGALQSLTLGGTAVAHDVRTVKGVDYWAFTATTGTYTATYQSADTTPPTVVSHVPVSGASGVAVSARPSVTFSEAVDPGSVTGSSVVLKAGSAVVPASVATSGSTVTVTPSADLAVGTVYTVTVSTGVTDLVGNALAAEQSWSFTTEFGTLTTAVPTISGTIGVGQTLTAEEGTWAPAPVAFTYQWLRDSSPVGTARTYSVTSADVGSKLSVSVTGTKTGYTTTSETSAQTVTIQPGTFVTAVPTITGTAEIGQALTAHPGTWNPTPDSITYQWLRGSSPISAATSATYPVTAADAGSKLSVTVTGTKTGYTTTSKTSDPTAAVPRGTLTTATPTITGTAVIGQQLKADAGSWGPGTVSLSYQWLRGTAEISGATRQTYTVAAADAGATLSVKVTGSKDGYTTASTTSVATAKVPTVAAPTPSVTGVVRVGMPVKVVRGTWAPTPTKFTYQWYWLKASGARVTIKHATKAAYTPTQAVKGHRLEVRIKAYRNTTRIATRYSAPTVKVQAGMTGRTPRISDTTPVVGQILTAKPGSWKPSQTTFTYQWYARSTSGRVSKIAGATAGTYQVEARYAGFKIKVKVIGTAPDYKPVAKTSSYTHKITK